MFVDSRSWQANCKGTMISTCLICAHERIAVVASWLSTVLTQWVQVLDLPTRSHKILEPAVHVCDLCIPAQRQNCCSKSVYLYGDMCFKMLSTQLETFTHKELTSPVSIGIASLFWLHQCYHKEVVFSWLRCVPKVRNCCQLALSYRYH